MPKGTMSADRLWTAMVLPITSDFRIDEKNFRRLIRLFVDDPRYSERGGLIVNPEAGDIFYLTREEKLRAVEIALEEAKGKVPVIAGSFALSTRDVVAHAKDAKDAGVDGLFVLPPGGAGDVTRKWDSIKYPEVWLDQIKEIDRAVDLPMITHPSAPLSPGYGGGLPAPTAVLLCKAVPNIVGWKVNYNYDGYRKMVPALRGLDRHVAILPANASYFHESLAYGEFDGTASGSWCYAMELMMDHYDAWRANDVEKARKIWQAGLRELHEYIYGESGRLHQRYKIAVWLRGFAENPFMIPPMPPPRQEEIDRIYALMKKVGYELRDPKDIRIAA